MMNDKIKENIDNAEQLEILYRADKRGFEKAFFEIYQDIAEYKMSDFWKARLEFGNANELPVKIGRTDILFLIVACAITGFLIKIPQLFDVDLKDYYFYDKNIGTIVFFGLSLYAFLTKELIKTGQLLVTLLVFTLSAVYTNMLPSDRGSDTLILVNIHLPLMIWCLYGFVFIGFDVKDKTKRIDYIKYNGELAILGAIILIAGGVLTGVTLGLFYAIDLDIKQFYLEYIVVWGLVSAPIVATYIIGKYPFVANKIAPVIANIFSPLVLITLVVYLVSILITGKDPYNDRDFLIVFNVMLLGVMGIVVFAISETSTSRRQRFNEMTLLALAVVTLIIDVVALSAILYRLGEFGFTPNRVAVLGSNVLVFGNLLLITIDLYRVNVKHREIRCVELTIAKYLPIYTLWTMFVVFVLPWLFGLK